MKVLKKLGLIMVLVLMCIMPVVGLTACGEGSDYITIKVSSSEGTGTKESPIKLTADQEELRKNRDWKSLFGKTGLNLEITYYPSQLNDDATTETVAYYNSDDEKNSAYKSTSIVDSQVKFNMGGGNVETEYEKNKVFMFSITYKGCTARIYYTSEAGGGSN